VLSRRFFWALGPPQIYPVLARLVEAGLVDGRDESRGRRPRRLYSLTKAGRRALEAWVRSSARSPLELRDPLLLRLFFGDFGDENGVRAQLEAMRRRSRDALERFEADILPAAEQTASAGHGHPTLVAEFGQGLHEFIERWCEERLSRG
jgi:DNA-binding PadR family transcriptional regulator